MSKRISIITGASGGIGKEFTRMMLAEEIDEIWAIARNKEKLIALRNECGDKVIVIYFSDAEIEASIYINCSVPAVLCSICIPYMGRGSRILNISSASAFQPLPYLNLYAATKAFVRSYSRSLNVELEDTGITSIAVCPSWVDTDLLMKEINGEKIRFPGIVSAEKAVRKALRDANKGKDMSVCSLYVKFEHFLAKVFPQKMTMNTWVRKIRRYLVMQNI